MRKRLINQWEDLFFFFLGEEQICWEDLDQGVAKLGLNLGNFI